MTVCLEAFSALIFMPKLKGVKRACPVMLYLGMSAGMA